MNINSLHIGLNNIIQPKLKKVLEQSCLLVEDEARRLCPVDTGTLRRSIEYQIDGNVGLVGTNIEYAPYLEFGTGIFAYDGQGRPSTAEHPIPWKYQSGDGRWHTTKGQQSQAFLRPALVNCEDNIKNIIKKEFKI